MSSGTLIPCHSFLPLTQSPPPSPLTLASASTFATVAGALYAPDVRAGFHEFNHSLVSVGTTNSVHHAVSDAVVDGEMVRVVTVKGFDAT